MKFNLPTCVVALSALGLIGGCGGGGGDSSPTASEATGVSGTVAVGHPVVGATVTVKCASGFTASVVTGSSGTWSTTIPSTGYPCAVQVTGGTVNGVALSSPLHSMMQSSGNVNVTPLTDLIVANVVGQDPTTWFNGVTNTQLNTAVTSANITSAVGVVNTVLASLPGQPSLPNAFNPITTPFNANQVDAGDIVLEDYATGLASAGLTREAATQTVASGSTQLTQEVQTLVAFTPNAAHTNWVQISAGMTKASDGTQTLAVADTVRGNKSAVVTSTDSDGNIAQLAAGPFNAVISFLGNKVGQICVEGNEDYDYDNGQRSQYAYVSKDMVEVTDLSEITGVQFKLYDGCAYRNNHMEYIQSSSIYRLTYVDPYPESPVYGIPQVQDVTGSYQVEDGSTYNTQKKVYKTEFNGNTRYVFIYSLPQAVVIGLSN